MSAVTPTAPPKKTAKRGTFAKTKGNYSPPKAAIINVAGEVFALNTNVNKFYDISGSYDQALKGDNAFDEFFLEVFDTMNNLTYSGKTEDIQSADAKQKIKARARDIYMNLFGVNLFLQQSPVKIPCSPRDMQILMQTLYYRRNTLLEQIKTYNSVSTSDMRARYLRDHLIFLNKLIQSEIPNKVGTCEDVDALLAGRKGASFGNLEEDQIKQLLNIFAFLIAQGRDPLQYFQSKQPIPTDILPKIGLKGAPTLITYESQLQIEGEDKDEYVQQKYTPTMKKIRDILYGTDFEAELEKLEDSFGIPRAQQNKTVQERVTQLIQAREAERTRLIADTTKCNDELRETQDKALAIIQQLEEQAKLRGSVRGLLQTAVNADIDLRDSAQKFSSFKTIYNSISENLKGYGLFSPAGPIDPDAITFGTSFIYDINDEFITKTKIIDVIYDKIIEYLYYDTTLDQYLLTRDKLQMNQKRAYLYERTIYQKMSQAYQIKIKKDKDIFAFYVSENEKLLKALQPVDTSKLPSLPQIIKDTKTLLEDYRKKAHSNFQKVLQMYNTNYTTLVDKLQLLNDAANPPNNPGSKFSQLNPANFLVPSNNAYRKDFNFHLSNLAGQGTTPNYLSDSNQPRAKAATIPPFNPNMPELPRIASINDIFQNAIAAVAGPAARAGSPALQPFNEFVKTSNPNHTDLLNRLEENLKSIFYEENNTVPGYLRNPNPTDAQINLGFGQLFDRLKLIQEVMWLVIRHSLFTYNIKSMHFFYEKLTFTEKRILAMTNFLSNPLSNFDSLTEAEKTKFLVYITACATRLECENEGMKNLYEQSFSIQEILKAYTPQFGGGARKQNDLPILSPKLIKRMIGQMKNNVLSGEVVEEEDNLESLMEIYGEETIDSKLGLCSLSMLFLLLEVLLVKENQEILHETIHRPLTSLQKDKAYELLEDFFSSFQDLDHSTELQFQLKHEQKDISEEATKQAQKLLSSMFKIEAPTKQYANDFIVFLQVVRTILEENSSILEELGCLIPT